MCRGGMRKRLENSINEYQRLIQLSNIIEKKFQNTSKEISQFLKLDNEISALGFLRIEAENEEAMPSADHDNESEIGTDSSDRS